MSSFLLYLFQVSVCHSAFYIMYRYFFSKHTFFQSNRVYILFTTSISFIIPLLNIGIWNTGVIENSIIYPLYIFSEAQISSEPVILKKSLVDWYEIVKFSLFTIYILGALIYLFKLLSGLRKISALIKDNETIDREWYKIIKIKTGPLYFSFLGYVFINDNKLSLTHDDLKHVLTHEKVHVQQRHTVDVLFIELVSVICWFNPFIGKIRQAIRQIHEYIADGQVISNTHDVEHYARLILKISSDYIPIPLTHQFSMINIKNRITMLNQAKHHTMKNLKFLFAIPLTLLLMSFFSFSEKSVISGDINPVGISGNQELIVGEISWEGNTKCGDPILNKVLGIKKGDIYSKDLIEKRLKYNPNGEDISSIYMDFGYLFFSIDIKEEIVENTINLNFKIFEGNTINIDKIIIKGNNRVETARVLEMIELKKGDLFNRSKLIQSQKNIAESGFFKSDEVGINPIPHDEFTLVDIEFVLLEL